MADLMTLRRRTLLGAALASAAPLRLLAQTPGAAVQNGAPGHGPQNTGPQAAVSPHAPIAFEVWRKGERIGTHRVDFQGGEQDFTVHMDVQMLVKFGPIPIFRYHHQAQETWRDGQFQRLQSHTTTNGGVQSLTAERTAAGISIAGKHTLTAPAAAHPLTHWNASVLEGPLFNPQTGAMVRDQVARTADTNVKLADGRSVEATRYTLTGQADIVDWYDAHDAWTALHAKAPDGSFIDYRKVV